MAKTARTPHAELRISKVTMAEAPPNYQLTARKLYERYMATMNDPEFEREYQEWRKQNEDHKRMAV